MERKFNELVTSLAIHAKIGRWGSLESHINERSKGARMLYLSPCKDEYYMVAVGNPLALNQGLQEEQVVPRHNDNFIFVEVYIKRCFSSCFLRIPL